MKPDLAVFKALVKQRSGLLFEGFGEANLVRALGERTLQLALTPEHYLARVQTDADEFQTLIQRLTINETYFFREPEQIRLLVEYLAPRLLARPGRAGPVRILSAGCSSGEEPYSLAMALHDRYGQSMAQLFSIVGGDIDEGVLTKARNACYSQFSFRGVAPALRQRYFEPDRWGYTLKEPVRKLVSFHNLNLLAPGHPAAALRDFDIVFFRNVSIYFDPPTRKIAQQNLVARMQTDAVLVTGATETLANDLGVLTLVEEDGVFYFVKGSALLPPSAGSMNLANAKPGHETTAFQAGFTQLHATQDRDRADGALATQAAPRPFASTVALPLPPAALPRPVAPAPDGALALARQQILERSYDLALPTLDALLALEPDHTEAGLLKAHVLINRRDFAGAQLLADRVLAREAWSVDAMLLHGLAAKWLAQTEAAIGWFKKAAYTRHDCWPAHYYLADLYRQNGQTELARRAYRSVLQLLSDNPGQSGLRYLPQELPEAQVRFLCLHQLAQLPAGRAVARSG